VAIVKTNIAHVMVCYILRRDDVKEEKEIKEIKFGMNQKLMLNIVALCFVLCITSCIAGYIQYSNTIKKLYNENAYTIGDMIVDSIDSDEISGYVETWQTDEYYDEMKLYLDNTLEASNAKYIYIAVPNADGTIKYVYDSSGMNIGDTDPVTKYLDEALAIYNTGYNDRTNYFVRKSKKYGYITCSIVPIVNSNNNTVALLFVDIAMELIQSTLRGYIIKAVLISFIMMLIALVLSYSYMNKSVISPIHKIEDCLHKFVVNNAEITEELTSINTNDELEDLSISIYSMENKIVHYINDITKITAEKERIGAELNVATQIQADMLPSIFPPFPDRTEFDIFASMHPAKEVGGDFYDFFMIDDKHVGLVMADVSGKGVPAALFMVISKTLIKNRAQMGGTPSEILRIVNNQLCENNKAEMFVTVWLGILDIDTGIITAASAGHEFPAIKHNGKYELLKDKHGFVLAGMENLKYKDYEIQLEKGDSLFVYTDGVAEATNSNNELFGTDRMIEALNIKPNGSCDEILKNVQNSIDDFVQDAPQFDDITMLCLEYYGG